MPKLSKIIIFLCFTFFINGFFAINAFATEASSSVYICPQATSLKEINPRCPGRINLTLGETINGLTLSVVNYENRDYYVVNGFTNGGGGVNFPPLASASGAYNGYGGLPISFNASSSTDPNNDSLQYRWDFNNDGIWDTDWLNASTVNHIWNNNYEGIVNLEISDGEFTAIATTTVVVKSPKSFKQDAVSELKDIKSNNPLINKKNDKIIAFINQSLNNNLWIDSSHLIFFEKDNCNNLDKISDSEELDFDRLKERCPKLGIMVFYYEKSAVELMKSSSEFKQTIDKLINADSLLAKVSISDAKNIIIQNPKFKKIVENQVRLAEKELQKANDELQRARPDKAVLRIAKSWLYSQLAIKFSSFK